VAAPKYKARPVERGPGPVNEAKLRYLLTEILGGAT
jgi:hypothetical protein